MDVASVCQALVDEFDDVLRGSAGQENLRDSRFFHGRNVGFGNDAADENGDVLHAFFVQQVHELRANGVVSTGKNGEADDVDVFLDSGGSDHLGRLPEAGVNDFHASVAQRPRDDLRPAIVAIKAGLGNQHSYFFLGHIRWRV